MRYASAVARKRSIKVVEVGGVLTVTISKAWSMLAAMIWDSFDKLDDRRIM